ncbi:uncharacterized protein LOC135676669 isoform X2 [Musa acuminata AAA Group]|uniref:uncharacterized protein LOC135676669 isoform X2 n=1 Tax=Musa acuminata AAA Group TaxID=214697 RepID=UPI0031D6A444
MAGLQHSWWYTWDAMSPLQGPPRGLLCYDYGYAGTESMGCLVSKRATLLLFQVCPQMQQLFPDIEGSVLESNQDIDSWFSSKDLEPGMTSLVLLLNIS